MARICVIGTRGIPSFVGGIETICENLYPLLVENQSKFEFVLLSRLTPDGMKQYSFKGVRVSVLAAPKISGLETFIHTFCALIYARLFVNPKLVHLHGIGPGFFSPLSRLLGFKTIVTHHAADYKRPKWRWHGKLILKLGELLTVIFAHKIICVSSSVLKELNQKYSFFIDKRLGRVDLCCTHFAQQYIGSHININASDTMLA